MKSNKQNYGRWLYILTTAALAVVFALGISGCRLPELDKGSLHIVIDADGTRWRSLLPDTDMVPVHYRIQGTGPFGSSFSKYTEGSDSVGKGLEAGEWNVSVSALNREGMEIGYGWSSVVIEAGELSTASVEVNPLEGTGELSLSVFWPSGEVPDAALEAFLADPSGNKQPLDFDAGTGTASFSAGGIPAGYYTLTIQLVSSGTVLGGIVDSVRIVQDSITEGSYSFTDINHPVGNVTVTVTVDMYDPLDVEMEGTVPVLAFGESMTVSVSVPDVPADDLVYTWYVNGAPAGSGDAAVLGADLRRGRYCLDVIVFTGDGSRSGSASHSFTVE